MLRGFLESFRYWSSFPLGVVSKSPARIAMLAPCGKLWLTSFGLRTSCRGGPKSKAGDARNLMQVILAKPDPADLNPGHQRRRPHDLMV